MIEIIQWILTINIFVIFYLTFAENGLTSYLDYWIRYISYRIGIYKLIDKIISCSYCLSFQLTLLYLIITQNSIITIFSYMMFQFVSMKVMLYINNLISPEQE